MSESISASASMAVTTLRSLGPYSQSRHLTVPKKTNESPDDYERRCWKQRLHTTKAGNVFIPPMAFTNSLLDAAKYLSLRVPGKGQATYTKLFEAGVRVIEPLVLPLKADKIQADELFLHANGTRGNGPRVTRFYPRIDEWSGTVKYLIMDPTIPPDVFRKVLDASGTLVGIGRFRPINRGYYGRFEVVDLKWIDDIGAAGAA